MPRLWTVLIALLALLAVSASAEPVRLEAMLVLASDEPAPLDYRLSKVEHKLRPLFRFPHYKLLGESSGVLVIPGETSLALGDGHHVDVASGGGGVFQVRWLRGGQPMLNTGVRLERGKPVILGGVPGPGGTLIVTLIMP